MDPDRCLFRKELHRARLAAGPVQQAFARSSDPYDRIAARSSSGVVIGARPNVSTRTFSTAGVTNAGSDGPSRMSRIPRWSSDSRMTTAFCSYHERMRDSGSELTSVSNAPARATAIWIAE